MGGPNRPRGDTMPKATAKCIDSKGNVLFQVESNGLVAKVMNDLNRKIMIEFDMCFEADDWKKIEIEINRA